MPYTGYSVVPRPVQVNANLAIFSTGYDKPSLLGVRLGDLKAGEERLAWTVEKNAPLTPTPLVLLKNHSADEPSSSAFSKSRIVLTIPSIWGLIRCAARKARNAAAWRRMCI